MLTVFDTVKNKKVTTIDVGGNNRHPDFVAMSPDGRKVYVASSSSYTPLAHLLYVVDVLSHTVTHSLDVGAFPKGLAVLYCRTGVNCMWLGIQGQCREGFQESR
jgi:YVTN family beta-propeller protein